MQDQFITGVSELISNPRLEIMSRINHPEEYYKQAFTSKGIQLSELTHAEICAGIAAMKVIEAETLIWAAENLPETPKEEIEKAVELLIQKGW